MATGAPPAPAAAAPAAAPAAPPAATTPPPRQEHNKTAAAAAGSAGRTTQNTATKKKQQQQKKKKKKKKTTQGDRLYADAQARRESLEKKRESLDASYTFTPVITRRGHKSAGPPSSAAAAAASPEQQQQQPRQPSPAKKTSPAARAEALFQDAAHRQATKAKRAQDIHAQECSFQPTLSKVSARVVAKATRRRKPLYYPNVNTHRVAERAKLRAKIEAERQAKVDAARVRKAQGKRLNSKQQAQNVVARMKVAEEKARARKAARLKRIKAQEDALCSFQPQITRSPTARPAAAGSGAGNAFERLHAGGKARSERLARLQREKERREQAQNTFRPKIRNKDGTLRLAAAKKDNASWIERQLREGTLRVKHKNSAPSHKQVHEQREIARQLEECTFKPAITSPDRGNDGHDGYYGTGTGTGGVALDEKEEMKVEDGAMASGLEASEPAVAAPAVAAPAVAAAAAAAE